MTEQFFGLLRELGPVNLAIGGGSLAALAGAGWWVARARYEAARSDYVVGLVNQSDAEAIAHILGPKSVGEHFASGLVTFEGALQRYVGRSLSWRSFNASLVFGFVAPVVLYAFAWLFGASGALGGVPGLPDLTALPERAARLCLVIGFVTSLLLFGAKFETIVAAMKSFTRSACGAPDRGRTAGGAQQSRQLARLDSPIDIIGQIFLALFFAATFAIGVVVAVYIAMKQSLGPALVLGFAIALAFAFNRYFVAALCAFGLGAIHFAHVGGSGGPIEPGLLLAFMVALPAPLGLAFFTSTTVTHVLMRDMMRVAPTPGGLVTIVLLVVCLLLAAGGCLAMLAAGAGATFDAANQLLAAHGRVLIGWRGAIEAASEAAYGEPVTWLPTGMALMVTAPPLLLIAHGLSALILAILPARRTARALLAAEPRLSPENRARTAKCLARLDLCRAPLRVAFTIALLIGAVTVWSNLDDYGFEGMARLVLSTGEKMRV